jgi:hypothetical protein
VKLNTSAHSESKVSAAWASGRLAVGDTADRRSALRGECCTSPGGGVLRLTLQPAASKTAAGVPRGQ